MASNKTYTVMKDGEEIRTLKTLAAAKKLADAEGAEVFCDGKSVYRAEAKAAADMSVSRYRLKHLMNVRTAPSLEAEKLGTLAEGAEVDVLGIEDDWMHVRLQDGEAYILYEGGKYAEEI